MFCEIFESKTFTFSVVVSKAKGLQTLDNGDVVTLYSKVACFMLLIMLMLFHFL